MHVNAHLRGQDHINAYMSSSRKSTSLDGDGADDVDEVDEECANDLEDFKKWLSGQGPPEDVSMAEGWSPEKERRAAAKSALCPPPPAVNVDPLGTAIATTPRPNEAGNDILPMGYNEGITPPVEKQLCTKCGKAKCALSAFAVLTARWL